MPKTPRPQLLDTIAASIKAMPVTVLLGARQVGKTTLAREYASRLSEVTAFDLEAPSDFQAMQNMAPSLALSRLNGLVLIDEVQRLPELFQILRPICDTPDLKAKYLLLGSASPSIIKGVSESLAGRARYLLVPPLCLRETGQLERHWLRGGFPLAFHAESDLSAFEWLNDFILSYTERDLPGLGLKIAAQHTRRCWQMLAHYHGQTLNLSDLSRSLDLDARTIRHLVDLLEGCYLVKTLQPWFANTGKRLVKSPKFYLRDTGLLHALLGIRNFQSLYSNPKYGASWEGFALMEILGLVGHEAAYFWATPGGAELDLLLDLPDGRIGLEFKASAAPTMTRSLGIAMRELALKKLYVVHPGTRRYPLADGIEAISLADANAELATETSADVQRSRTDARNS